jgi:hypothetical protein
MSPGESIVETRFSNADIATWAAQQGLPPHDPFIDILSSVTGLSFAPNPTAWSGPADKGFVELDQFELLNQ